MPPLRALGSAQFRYPKGGPLDIIKALSRYLTFDGSRRKIVPVGSVRRGEPPPHKDIDVLVVMPTAPTKTPLITVLPRAAARSPDAVTINSIRLLESGKRHNMIRISYTCARDARRASSVIDMFITTPNELPFALYHYTGPKSYNIRTRAHAKRNGMKLNQYGLFYADTNRRVGRPIRSERDLAAALGVHYRAPQNRV